MRAIRSVVTQEQVAVEIIVVVNGNRFDPQCYQELMGRPELKVVYQQQGSAPLAARLGRSMVAAPFFAFLDDDDEYLPGALSHRLQPMLTDEGVDYVASNGFRRLGDEDRIVVRQIKAIGRDPLLALNTENWLASCGGLFRSTSVSVDYFDGKTAYLEWTFLAYELASSLRMAFVDVPTFRIYDSPGSLSKSRAYREAEIAVLAKVLDLDLPRKVKRSVRLKRGRAYHTMSADHCGGGDIHSAWRYHFASLLSPQGWKYLLYTRKLVGSFLPNRTRTIG